MPNFVLIPIILFVVIGIYLLSYSLNSNTDAPEGTEPISKCSTCGSGSCSLAGSKASKPKENCEIDLEELKID